jgi:hypothetical protein
MKLTRILMVGGLTLAAAGAIAMPSWLKDFCELGKVAKGSTVEKASCSLCHVGKTLKLNPFGADLKKGMETAKAKKVTADLLKSVGDLDSDKDGAKNADEWKADTLPGDAKSVPAKSEKKE